jgi:uncharacterized protein (TIGR02611 family)
MSRLVAYRASVRNLPGGRLLWRLGVTVAGLVIIAVGIVLLPLPGPGWLIIFLGLGLWSTEYAWAARLRDWTRRQVMQWWAWIGRRPRWLQIVIGVLGLAFTASVSLAGWYLV